MRIVLFLISWAAALGALVGALTSTSLAAGELPAALAIAGGTFISEDLTCITTGLLIGRGELSAATGVAACFVGIFVGDLGLWIVGRWLRRGVRKWRWLDARLPSHRLAELGAWFDRHAPTAIVTARFVPGLRLPLYVAAGAVGRQPRAFVVWTLLAAAVWTPALVLASASVGEAFAAWFAKSAAVFMLSVAVMFLILRLAMMLATRDGRIRLHTRVARLWRWEFWPAWIFYIPLIPWIAWLSLRHRGLMLITAVNPGMPHGGFIGESKTDILANLPAEFVAPFVRLPSGSLDRRLDALRRFLAARAIDYPVILKPDAGQRGVGVRLARCESDARACLDADHGELIAQAFHPGPFEAGIFYYRIPGEPRGHIFSITDKVFPAIVGDGSATLEQLIWRHSRYRMQAGTFLTRHRDRLDDVVPAGETFRLAVAGNHCQGTMFRDGSRLLTPELESAIDRIARSYEGFYFGRFDVRYADEAEFKNGRGFTIIELNGATSESTNIYDPANSLFSAWHTLFRQWSLLFRIAALNRARGHGVTGATELWREIRGHYRDRTASLIAD